VGGLYITADGGASWTTSHKFAGITATSLIVDPNDPNTLYVSGACYAGYEPVPLPGMGLFKSTDGGLTWVSVAPGAGILSQCVTEFAIDPLSPEHFFFSGPYSDIAGRLESYDSGRTWEGVRASRPSLAVLFDPRYPFTHYGITSYFGAAFLTSQDGGLTWTSALPTLPLASGTFASLRALSIDPERGRLFLGTGGGLFRSGDGGRVWAPTQLPEVGVNALSFGGTSPALFAATTRGLFGIADRGLGEARSIDLHQMGANTTALDIDPSDPMLLYASVGEPFSTGATPVFGQTFQTTNGGASWEPLPGDSNVAMTQIVVDAGGTVYASSFRAHSLYRRRRGETQWTMLRNDIYVNAMVADPKTPGKLFLSSSGIERSTDSGNTWQRVGSISGSALAIDSSDPRWIYAGSEYNLYRSGDGGTTWVDIQPEPRIINGTRGIVVAPSNGKVIYRIGANVGSPRPERSEDRGITWRAATLPGGVYPSLLAVDPRNENSVWAAVSQYGSGLFRSADGGAHWKEVLGPFGTSVTATALRFDPSGRVLHVAYPGHGVWELTVECEGVCRTRAVRQP
jgi:photosystem II stability/assembly factor-like uncharacterized protein